MEQPQPQREQNTNWFDNHKLITGFSIVAVFVFLVFLANHVFGIYTATLGAQTSTDTPTANQTASPTLLPTDTPTDTPIPSPTARPTKVIFYATPTPTIVFIPPTATPIPANTQTTTQQQCAGATALVG